MRNFSLLPILLLLTFIGACRDYAEVTPDRQQTTIKWESGGLDSVRVEDWSVGPLKRQTLSMGVRMRVNFPLLKESDIADLGERYGLDSWLLSFSRSSLGRRERLGSFYMPMFRTAGRTGGGPATPETGYIDYFYAAASISARLRALNCPALDHRLRVSEVNVRDTNRARQLFVVGPMQESPFLGKAVKLEFQRNIINGGESLLGEYEVSFALYNSKTNRVLSNEVTAPQILIVSGESTENISGCENAKTPPLREGGDGIEKFKFGR